MTSKQLKVLRKRKMSEFERQFPPLEYMQPTDYYNMKQGWLAALKWAIKLEKGYDPCDRKQVSPYQKICKEIETIKKEK